jgi:hypothetical protein
MMKMAGVNTREIIQISILVRNPDGDIIYG